MTNDRGGRRGVLARIEEILGVERITKLLDGKPLSLSEKYSPISSVENSDEAQVLLLLYITHGVLYSQVDDAVHWDLAKEIELSNIGYWAGYYDEETYRRILRLFGEEAFRLGEREGKKNYPPREGGE